MPNVYCCVVGCHSSIYQLKKWGKADCDLHAAVRTSENCDCSEPYKLLPFPKAEDQRSSWIKAIGRKDTKHSWKSWQPNKDARICTLHFKGGFPSQENPNPSELLGHEVTVPKTTNVRRPLVRLPIVPTKKPKKESPQHVEELPIATP